MEKKEFSETQKKILKYICVTLSVAFVVGIWYVISSTWGGGSGGNTGGINTGGMGVASASATATKASGLIAAGVGVGIGEIIGENVANTNIKTIEVETNTGFKTVRVVNEEDAQIVRKIQRIDNELELEQVQKQEKIKRLVQERAERQRLEAQLEDYKIEQKKLMQAQAEIQSKYKQTDDVTNLKKIEGYIEKEIIENAEKQKLISDKLEEEYAILKSKVAENAEKRAKRIQLAKEHVIDYVVNLKSQTQSRDHFDNTLPLDPKIEYIEKNVKLIHNKECEEETVKVIIIRENIPKVMCGQNVIDGMSAAESMRLCKYNNEYGIIYCENRLILYDDIQLILDQVNVLPYMNDSLKASVYFSDAIWLSRFDESNPRYNNVPMAEKRRYQYAEELMRAVAWLKCGSGKYYLHFWKNKHADADPDILD